MGSHEINKIYLPFSFSNFPSLSKASISSISKEYSLLEKKPDALEYQEIYKSFPEVKTNYLNVSSHDIQIGKNNEIDSELQKEIVGLFQKFIPWRKGPFSIFGISIDAEWQSFQKWNRIKNYIPDIKDKIVCDIGCNNGYYMYKLLEYKPKIILGLDPVLKYYYQFLIFQKCHSVSSMEFWPFGFQILSHFKKQFDLILCMGILYHHQDPIKILKKIHHALNPKGKILIESLSISSEDSISLFPGKKYAGISGVWYIPSKSCLVSWLRKCNFTSIEVFYHEKMDPKEQIKTKWAPYYNYADYVNKENTKTIEGFPSANRICILAEKG